MFDAQTHFIGITLGAIYDQTDSNWSRIWGRDSLAGPVEQIGSSSVKQFSNLLRSLNVQKSTVSGNLSIILFKTTLGAKVNIPEDFPIFQLFKTQQLLRPQTRRFSLICHGANEHPDRKEFFYSSHYTCCVSHYQPGTPKRGGSLWTWRIWCVRFPSEHEKLIFLLSCSRSRDHLTLSWAQLNVWKARSFKDGEETWLCRQTHEQMGRWCEGLLAWTKDHRFSFGHFSTGQQDVFMSSSDWTRIAVPVFTQGGQNTLMKSCCLGYNRSPLTPMTSQRKTTVDSCTWAAEASWILSSTVGPAGFFCSSSSGDLHRWSPGPGPAWLEERVLLESHDQGFHPPLPYQQRSWPAVSVFSSPSKTITPHFHSSRKQRFYRRHNWLHSLSLHFSFPPKMSTEPTRTQGEGSRVRAWGQMRWSHKCWRRWREVVSTLAAACRTIQGWRCVH